MLQIELGTALSKGVTSPELLDLACKLVAGDLQPEPVDSQQWPVSNRTMAAAVVLRDADEEALGRIGDLARAHLELAVLNEGPRSHSASSLTLHEVNVAALGLVADARRHPGARTYERLLALATRSDVHLAGVLKQAIEDGRALEPAVMTALLRTGLACSVQLKPPARARPRDGDWSTAEDAYREQCEQTKKLEAERQAAHRQSELDWLCSSGPEPTLPAVPAPLPKQRERNALILGSARAEARPVVETDLDGPSEDEEAGHLWLRHDLAAPWLDLARVRLAKDDPQALSELLQRFASWSMLANGSDCGPQDEPGERPTKWNPAYYGALTAATVHGAPTRALIDAVAGVADQRFFEISASVLSALDAAWIDGVMASAEVLIEVRSAFQERLMSTSAWSTHVGRPDRACPRPLNVCIAAVFLGASPLGGQPSCWLNQRFAAKAYELLPLLRKPALEGGASWWVALGWLGLLEALPTARNASYLREAVELWFRANGADRSFWEVMSVADRVCRWIGAALDAHDGDLDAATLEDLNAIVDILLRCGQPAARAVEERLKTLESRSR
jgi:hypothetical protein